MSIECDEELGLHMLESGHGSFQRKQSVDESVATFLPDEVLACLAEHSCETLSDKLAFSLISEQHRSVVRELLKGIVHKSFVRTTSSFDPSHLVDYFSNWSLIGLFSQPVFVSEEEHSRTSLSFYCKSCRSLIITQNEVESPHYHGGHGPAFLAHCVFNCHHSADEGYETQFTTGVYRVCDVTCDTCGSRVGKQYLEARDPANFFKVGKFLLEQTLLSLPKCCSNRRLDTFPPEHYYCARDAGLNSFCSVCLQMVRVTVATAALEMTHDLDPQLTMKLYSLLQTERQVLLGDQISTPDETSPVSAVSSSISPSSISRRVGDVISRFVRKSLSPASTSHCEPLSPCHQVLIGGRSPIASTVRGRLSDDQIIILSHCLGQRLGMLPECQNWISSMKFVTDLMTATCKQSMLALPNGSTAIHLNRCVLIESMLASCGPISYHSVTLLLCRVPNMEDRRAVVAGVSKNLQSSLSSDEEESLRQLTGGSSAPAARWSSQR